MTSQTYFALIVVLLLVVQTLGASVLRRRSLPESAEDSNKPVEVCQRSTPCGWAVYTRFTRVIDYFMKNKCECPGDKKCIRTDDDISVAAYVYRCKDSHLKDMDLS